MTKISEDLADAILRAKAKAELADRVHQQYIRNGAQGFAMMVIIGGSAMFDTFRGMAQLIAEQNRIIEELLKADE